MTTGSTPEALRSGLRRLATGLIAYGLVGLAFALVATAALVWAGGRLSDVGGRVETQVAAVVDTLDRTSTALRDAGTSATSFAVTMERTPPAVRQTAETIGVLRADLLLVEGQLFQIEILGRRPLGSVAEAFGRMASNLDGLDTQLALIAADLEGNRTALLANSASLGSLGVRVGLIADDLRGGAVEDGVEDLRTTVTVMASLLVAWMAVPAAGAVWLGWSLRRALGRDEASD